MCQKFSAKKDSQFYQEVRSFWSQPKKGINLAPTNLLDVPRSVMSMMGGRTDLLGDPKSVS